MSANIKASKIRAGTSGSAMPGVGSIRPIPAGMYRGDPGFFGDLWGGIKGAATGLVTGGPLGAIGGAIGGFTGASRDPAPPTLPPMLNPRGPVTGGRIGGLLPGGAKPYVGLDYGSGGGDPAMRAGKASGTPGYHWNKSGYFLKSGQWVAPGTKEVKNRRMNPLNPRAVKSSMRRIGRAKTAAKDLSRVTIRAKKCAR